MKRWSIVKNLLTLLFFNDQTTASVTPPNVSGGITAGGWAVIGNVIAVITLKSKRAFETLNYCFHSSFSPLFIIFMQVGIEWDLALQELFAKKVMNICSYLDFSKRSYFEN